MHACRPGASLRDLHALSVRLISEGLLQLGACGAGVRLRQIEGGLYRRFYWHSVGHWLGLDTHDTPLVGYDRCAARWHWVGHLSWLPALALT